MRVCHVVASINRNTGGPAVTVPRLASALAAAGVTADLASLDYLQHGEPTPAPNVRRLSQPAGATARFGRGWSRSFQRALAAHVGGGVQLVHNHGLWMFPNLYARQAAARAGVPLVISPRGMVEAWSLGRSRLKKFFVWHAFEKNNLVAAKMFHATSTAEGDSLRALGFRQPVAVIPNGMDLPDLITIPARGALERRFPELLGKRWLLFLSRLHPKKGVVELLRAWTRLAPRYPDWHLILAGPDLDGYGETMRCEAASLGIAGRVTFPGMLAGDDKFSALANADLFVLPTRSENFGIAIAEALAHGVPVVTTTGAPWSELRDHGCGWWIELSDTALLAALEPAMNLPAEQRREMGRRGRELVALKYSWSGVAEQMKAAYLWLLGRAAQPAWVRTE